RVARDAVVRETRVERARLVVDREDVEFLRAVLRAATGVDEDRARDAVRTRAADQEQTRRERDAVAVVGRLLTAPERLGHRAEHRAAVEPEGARDERPHVVRTDLHGGGEWANKW